MKVSRTILFFAVTLFAATPVYAQQTGEVTGTITDSTGAVVANVTVTTTNTGTQQTRTTTSNSTGTYNLPYLLPGVYEVRAEGTGFKASVRAGVAVEVGGVARLDFKMAIGAVSEQVEDVSNPDLLSWRPGNGRRNTLYTPGSQNFNASLARDIRLWEAHTLDLRFEAFNALNHPNWRPPSADPRSPATFGVVTSAYAMRQLQFAVKYSF
jgi:hypothetical protein